MLRAMAEPVISPPEATLSAPPEHSRRQLETLLEVSEAIAQQRDLRALFHDLSERLHAVVEFDFLTLVLHDAARNVMRLHILETREPYEKPEGMEHPVENHPSGWVWQTQQAFVSDDTETDERYPDFFTRLRAHNVVGGGGAADDGAAAARIAGIRDDCAASFFGQRTAIHDARGEPGGGGGGQRAEPREFAGLSAAIGERARPAASAAGDQQPAGDDAGFAGGVSRDCFDD